MNKQELIGNYKRISNFCETVSVNKVIQELEQLTEPKKVQVPQFVADWIDNMKCQGKTLYYGLDHTPPEEVDLWFCEDEVNRQNTFARAWLDGYEVEKEPKYTVKFKATKQYLSNDELGPHFDPSFRSNFTKSDLEKLGLAEVFNSPLFEVEEVQDDSKI